MLVCRDPSIAFTPEDRQNIGPAVQAWVAEMEQRGVRLQGDVLAPVTETLTVSVRAGEAHVDRGPRGDASVPASGFNLLHCADVDEAIEVSASHPIARFGVVELRPIADS